MHYKFLDEAGELIGEETFPKILTEHDRITLNGFPFEVLEVKKVAGKNNYEAKVKPRK